MQSENEGLSLLPDLAHEDQCISVDGIANDGMIRVASTSEVLWLDERYPRRPVISVKHDRRLDKTLHVQTIPFEKREYWAAHIC